MVRLRIIVPAARPRVPLAMFVRANGERVEGVMLDAHDYWDFRGPDGRERVLVTPAPQVLS